jgi:hypothetical protein
MAVSLQGAMSGNFAIGGQLSAAKQMEIYRIEQGNKIQGTGEGWGVKW